MYRNGSFDDDGDIVVIHPRQSGKNILRELWEKGKREKVVKEVCGAFAVPPGAIPDEWPETAEEGHFDTGKIYTLNRETGMENRLTNIGSRMACKASEYKKLGRELCKFYDEQQEKLKTAIEQGKRGWDRDTYFKNKWKEELKRHADMVGSYEKTSDEIDNLIDIANLCAFGYYHLMRE